MITKKALVFLFLIGSSYNFGCTGIRLHAQDNSVIYARTLEWRHNLNPYAIVVPCNTHYIGSSINNNSGKQWSSLYAFVGITIGNRPFVIDGINEHGLGVGLFAFRDDVEYSFSHNDSSNDLAPWQLPTYLLSTCATVEEVKEAITTINVVPVFLEDVNEVPPLHYIVHDAQGDCIVLEHCFKNITLYEDPIGTITNSPNFDWHLTNLNNYLNPSFDNSATLHLFNVKTLNESYALGLPSDFSSPSRFVRAAIYSQCAPIPATGHLGILQAFHILNQFDIPKGTVRSYKDNYFTYTHWTSAANLAEKKYYFRTYDNQRIRMINLMNVIKNITHIIWITMDDSEEIKDISHSAKK